MDWWIWVAVVLAVVMFAIDWLIVMGTNPRNWKGGEKHDRKQGADRKV